MQRTPSKRLYALDNLRACLAILGILFHTALFLTLAHSSDINLFSENWVTLALNLNSTSQFFLFSILYVHTFRMPTFFLLAGFFARYLYQQRGLKKFMRNRLYKIGVPFLFCLACNALIYFVGMIYLYFISPKLFEQYYTSIMLLLHNPRLLGKISITDTWFLYYLLWFYFATFFILQIQQYSSRVKIFLTKISAQLHRFFTSTWRYIVISIIFSLLLFYPHNFFSLLTNTTLAAPITIVIYYGCWYCLGWWLWRRQKHFEKFFNDNYIKIMASLGFYAIFLWYNFHYQGNKNIGYYCLKMFFYQLSACLSSFALFGIAWRHIFKENRVMRYLSQSSYWLYLSQLQIIWILIALSLPNKNNFIAYSLTISITTLALSLLSYHFFVRYTWLNRFFGGKTIL